MIFGCVILEMTPLMLQAMKAATRKEKNIVEKKSGYQKTLRKRALTEPKQLDLNVTISVGSSTILLEHLKKIEEFIEKNAYLVCIQLKEVELFQDSICNWYVGLWHPLQQLSVKLSKLISNAIKLKQL